MVEYLFITATNCGNDVAVITIKATDKNEALVKAYSYFGGGDITEEEFGILCQHNQLERMRQIFYAFTRETILYFAEKPKNSFVDDTKDIEVE